MNDEDRCMYCRAQREDHTASHPFAPLPSAPTQAETLDHLRAAVLEEAVLVAEYYQFDRVGKAMRKAAMFRLARAVKDLEDAKEAAHIAEKQS